MYYELESIIYYEHLHSHQLWFAFFLCCSCALRCVALAWMIWLTHWLSRLVSAQTSRRNQSPVHQDFSSHNTNIIHAYICMHHQRRLPNNRVKILRTLSAIHPIRTPVHDFNPTESLNQLFTSHYILQYLHIQSHQPSAWSGLSVHLVTRPW